MQRDYHGVLKEIARRYVQILREDLVGIYVHGSLAFGCFHPNTSDIDFLVVVKRGPSLVQKQALIQVLLDLQDRAPAKGFEMSVVRAEVCKRFAYPTPYELHFSVTHLARCYGDLLAYCTDMHGVDPDLAAHFTVTRQVGYPVYGLPVADVFGEVPKEAYLDSIRYDISSAVDDVEENPVYVLLNLCRALAYIREGIVLSKEDGGVWGISHVPPDYRKLIEDALNGYQTGKPMREDIVLAKAFCKESLCWIQEQMGKKGKDGMDKQAPCLS